jgi:hypothetical protein
VTLAQAEAELGVSQPYDQAAVSRAFRVASRRAHPDAGGDQSAFIRLTEARDLLLAHLSGKVPASPLPPTQAPTQAQQAQQADQGRRWWRERQHTPWNTRDARSRAWEARGQDWSQAQPEPLAQSTGVSTFGILVIDFGPLRFDGAGWQGRFVQQGGRVLAAIYPPVPIIIGSEDVVCSIFFSADRQDALLLKGPIVERSYDKSGRVIMVCADLLSGL